MPKNGFPMPTAKNGFRILNLHYKKYIFKNSPLFNGSLLEKYRNQYPFQHFTVSILTLYSNNLNPLGTVSFLTLYSINFNPL